MMHNKVMVVDGIWSTVGSINFVNRSMKKNAEVNVAVYDRGFAALVEDDGARRYRRVRRPDENGVEEARLLCAGRRDVLLVVLRELLTEP
jgi:cardiolipin synthase